MGETVPDTNSYPRKAGMHPNPGSVNHPAAVLSMELGAVLGRAGHFPELSAMLLVCSQNLSLVAVCYGRCPIGLQGETSCSCSHLLIIPKAPLRQRWDTILVTSTWFSFPIYHCWLCFMAVTAILFVLQMQGMGTTAELLQGQAGTLQGACELVTWIQICHLLNCHLGGFR